MPKQPELLDEAALVPVRQSSSGELELILQAAANPDVPVDKMERLLALHERILDRNAKAEFDGAFAEMAARLPTVIEKAKTNNGMYATLEDIVETVRPILSAHGFALSHKTEWPDKGTVKVIGILTHRSGYSRESEFLSGADTSGNKNTIQALGSAVAYGRRYTTKDLLNIVTRAEDDDGQRADVPKANAPKGYAEWIDGMEDVADEGTVRLESEWKKAHPSFRAYISQHEAKRWAALKTKAAQRGA